MTMFLLVVISMLLCVQMKTKHDYYVPGFSSRAHGGLSNAMICHRFQFANYINALNPIDFPNVHHTPATYPWRQLRRMCVRILYDINDLNYTFVRSQMYSIIVDRLTMCMFGSSTTKRYCTFVS